MKVTDIDLRLAFVIAGRTPHEKVCCRAQP
jgi:hypothetical protein